MSFFHARLNAGLLLSLLMAIGSASSAENRKALVIGRGGPTQQHPEIARLNFLRLVGNLSNDPAKGWTCDFSDPLMERLGMNPNSTPIETLFKYIREHNLGYRIVIACGPFGNTLPYWRCAVENDIMPFAPQGNNSPGHYVRDFEGLHAGIGVAGGVTANGTSIGPGVEFFDTLPLWASSANYEDAAQSWANQAVAAKFAHVLDAHPRYNNWDARQHLRQSASGWAAGWNEHDGYGRPDKHKTVSALEPAPPLEFKAELAHDRHSVRFTWLNFLQTDFAATIIARKDGRILYEGTGTNFVWKSDVNGSQAFQYWSRNKSGKASRLESYQTRTLTNLEHGVYHACLVLGAPGGETTAAESLCERFHSICPGWLCDIALRPGNPFYDKAELPNGDVVAVLPGIPAMVEYAITNHYRILLPSANVQERDLSIYSNQWTRATAAGIAVIVPHYLSLSRSHGPGARRNSSATLGSAITVGYGDTNNLLSYGPGLEFFDYCREKNSLGMMPNQTDAAAIFAGKFAQVLDANPRYNCWDARQYLRQSSSYYTEGWREDGGFGRPAAKLRQFEQLDPAPPVETSAAESADKSSVQFYWKNFLQSDFAETVVQVENGEIIYHGTGSQFVWNRGGHTNATFRFLSRDKSGHLSRPESFSVVQIPQ